MKTSNFILLFLLTLPLLLSTSCGKNASSVDSDTSVADTAASSDTTKAEKKDTVVVKELKFDSAQAAVDYMRNSGHWAEYQDGILPRMAEEVLDYTNKLLNNQHKYFIVVDKAAMKVILYNKYGQKVKEYGCAASKNFGNKKRRGDSRTAEGYFTAEGVYDSTDWLFTNDAGYTSPARGQFGPRFIRLKQSPSIGIHGTAAPGSIGRRVSHGCIRITNDNIMDLVKYAEAGMPIIVSPGPQDMRVNLNEGTPVPSVTTGATKTTPAANVKTEPSKSSKDTGKQTGKKEKVGEDNTNNEKAGKTEEVKQTEKPAEKPAEKTKETPVVTPQEPVNP